MSQSIRKEQVFPLILEACPSFQGCWDKLDDEERGLGHVVMGRLAHHLLSLYLVKQTDEFGPLCETVECLLVDGGEEVQELATIGLLEGIQNVWSNSAINPDEFLRFLLPEGRKWWKEISDFWSGKIPYVGASLHAMRSKRTPPKGKPDL
ncbi:MAG: hypothetical protein HGA74_16975 [Deltaproteobacteria bacterium]|nr:hypothetical protein [Deltaproteobacteria bacterium]NTV80580.1 hypothetical protein [Candidatus Aminicenantes bacterium]